MGDLLVKGTAPAAGAVQVWDRPRGDKGKAGQTARMRADRRAEAEAPGARMTDFRRSSRSIVSSTRIGRGSTSESPTGPRRGPARDARAPGVRRLDYPPDARLFGTYMTGYCCHLETGPHRPPPPARPDAATTQRVDLRVGSAEVSSESSVTRRISPGWLAGPGHSSASVVLRVLERSGPGVAAARRLDRRSPRALPDLSTR